MSAPEQGSKPKPVSNYFLPETHFHLLSILDGSRMALLVQFLRDGSFFFRLQYSFGDFCSHTSYPKLALLSSSKKREKRGRPGKGSSGTSFFLLLSVLLSSFSLPWSEREPSVPLTFHFFPAVCPSFRNQYFLLGTICSLRAALLKMLG